MKIHTIFLFLLVSLCVSSKNARGTEFVIHQKNIHDFCFSPDGKALFVSSGNDIRVYDSSQDSLLYELKGTHTGGILSLDVSKDDRLLVSGGKDSSVVVWDLAARRQIKTLKNHRGIVTTVHISADGKKLVSGGTDHRVFMYDLADFRLIHEFPEAEDDVLTTVFSPDGNLLAMAGASQPIRIYRVEDYRLLATLGNPKDWYGKVYFSPYQTKLYACGYKGSLSVWDVSDPDSIRFSGKTPISHDWLLDLAQSGTRMYLATGGMSGVVFVKTPFVDYKKRVDSPILNVSMRPATTPEQSLTLAVAHRKGVRIFPLNAMDSSNFDQVGFDKYVGKTNIIDKTDELVSEMVAVNSLESALILLDKSIRLDKMFSQYYVLKAGVLFRQNKPDLALQTAESYLKLDPEYDLLNCLSALLCDEMGQTSKAAAWYRKSLEKLAIRQMSPMDDLQAYNNVVLRAIMAHFAGRQDLETQAMLEFKQAYPNDGTLKNVMMLSRKDFIPVLLKGITPPKVD